MDVYRCEGLREENTKMFARKISEDHLTLLLLTAQMWEMTLKDLRTDREFGIHQQKIGTYKQGAQPGTGRIPPNGELLSFALIVFCTAGLLQGAHNVIWSKISHSFCIISEI